jgi:fatty acid desaturase
MRPEFRRWFLPVLTEWALAALILAAAALADSWWVWPPAVLLLGTRQHALSILGHDAAHFLASPRRRLNDRAAELLCFWPLMAGLTAYRRFHFRHHAFLGTPEDPEREHLRGWSRPHFDPPKSRRRFARYVLGDLVGLGLVEVYRAVKLVGRDATTRDRVGPVLWWLSAGGALVALGLWPVVLAWFAALGTSFWMCFRLRIWTEHCGTDGTHKVTASWPWRAFVCPRNTWCHAEHHANPGIPFWALPAARTGDAVTVGELFRRHGMEPQPPAG